MFLVRAICTYFAATLAADLRRNRKTSKLVRLMHPSLKDIDTGAGAEERPLVGRKRDPSAFVNPIRIRKCIFGKPI